MSDPTMCPECSSCQRTRQMTQHLGDTVGVMYTCDSCPTQWVVEYADALVKKKVNA